MKYHLNAPCTVKPNVLRISEAAACTCILQKAIFSIWHLNLTQQKVVPALSLLWSPLPLACFSLDLSGWSKNGFSEKNVRPHVSFRFVKINIFKLVVYGFYIPPTVDTS